MPGAWDRFCRAEDKLHVCIRCVNESSNDGLCWFSERRVDERSTWLLLNESFHYACVRHVLESLRPLYTRSQFIPDRAARFDDLRRERAASVPQAPVPLSDLPLS